MSLPPLDGVNHRYYLIHSAQTPKEVLEQADLCIQDLWAGKVHVDRKWPFVVKNHCGVPFLPRQILDRYLRSLIFPQFSYEKAVAFCRILRHLVGWKTISYTLEKFIERCVQERYFDVQAKDDWMRVFPICTLKEDFTENPLDEGLLQFTCYVAVCFTVYGASFDTLTTRHYFKLVEKIRPAMVKKLKEAGTGKLPKNLQSMKTDHMTAKANDAFAVIRITQKSASRRAYREVLSYLCAVVSEKAFPESFSIEYRGPEKLYLPIRGLPKKGVHQLFACAVRFKSLHKEIRRYARLVMREFTMYQNMGDTLCVLPGTFAVFALGMYTKEYSKLLCDYLDRCDDEHSSLQEKFIHAYIEKFGFTAETLPVFVHGIQSMQGFRPAKSFAKLVANERSVKALLHLKNNLSSFLFRSVQPKERDLILLWARILYAIWGPLVLQHKEKIIKTAPHDLQDMYCLLLREEIGISE